MGRRAQGRWECRRSCLRECRIHTMSRVQTRHLEEMAGLASTTFTTRRRKPPALLLCGLVGWMAGHGRIIRSSSWPSSLLFGPVWLRYFGISRGPQPDSTRTRVCLIEKGTCLVWSTMNRLDQARSWAPFCSTTSLTNLNPLRCATSTTPIFVGVTQCEVVQHCYPSENATVSERNRCANQSLGDCLASDWDLSVKTKEKGAWWMRVFAIHKLHHTETTHSESCAIDSNSILHR